MQRMLLLSLFALLVDGVFDAETGTMMSVMEGDSVTLHTNLTEILNDDTLLWVFGPKGFVISQITRKNDLTSFFITDDVGFRERLQMNQITGSLTIRNTRIRHSGQYKLTVSRKKTTTKTFNVTVIGVAGETGGVKSVSVMEGDSVTLQNDVTELQEDDLIVWRFGDKGILLAKIDVETNETSLNVADERFKERLQLNDQTGSLLIKNTRTEHSGLYEVQIRGSESSRRFLLSVTALPDPGLSPGLIVGIAAAVLLFLTAVVAVVVIYYCHKFSEPKKQVVRTEPVKSGDFVTLNIDSEIKSDDLILWTFGAKNCLVVKVDSGTTTISENFIGRLQLDHQSGSLTIRNTRTTDSGVYKLQIINSEQTTFRRFNVTVTGSE
uniref:Immunoglobulin domain-containing protein n=1 Tax=Cyprinus carpio TaxID=7962 RepID=A0A8C1S3U9_CYPCA